jgi:hypothetical protein
MLSQIFQKALIAPEIKYLATIFFTFEQNILAQSLRL